MLSSRKLRVIGAARLGITVTYCRRHLPLSHRGSHEADGPTDNVNVRLVALAGRDCRSAAVGPVKSRWHSAPPSRRSGALGDQGVVSSRSAMGRELDAGSLRLRLAEGLEVLMLFGHVTADHRAEEWEQYRHDAFRLRVECAVNERA